MRVILMVITSLVAGSVYASETPYIDRLKESLPPQEETPSLIDTVRAKKGPASQESYIEQLKSSDPNQNATPESESYTESEKRRLEQLDHPDSGGAIAAVKEGRSELTIKKKGKIHGAAGLRLGASMQRKITGNSDLVKREFTDIYGTGWNPDVTLFYEYQPFRSEVFGNIGIGASVGVQYFKGEGKFKFSLTNPVDPSKSFGSNSKVRFDFYTVPVAAQIYYRFHLLKYVRPYVAAGPAAVGYYEHRVDNDADHRGLSAGLQANTGIAILMDWVSRSADRDLYTEHNVKHYYLTLDYQYLKTTTGDLAFSYTGVLVGFTFEF